MPELLLELFSEEIPARMQARAADDLARGALGAARFERVKQAVEGLVAELDRYDDRDPAAARPTAPPRTAPFAVGRGPAGAPIGCRA